MTERVETVSRGKEVEISDRKARKSSERCGGGLIGFLSLPLL